MNFCFKIKIAFFNYLKRIYAVFGVSTNIARHDIILNRAFNFQMKAQVFPYPNAQMTG